MTHVILTIGISGSGKSTYAKNFKAGFEHTKKVVIVERDEIRESLKPGSSFVKDNSLKFEEEVTKAQRRLILNAVNAKVDYILISDTNLDTKHRNDLEDFLRDRCGVSKIEHRVMEDSYNLKLCLKRNQNRLRVVDREVLIRQWKTFQNLFASSNYIVHADEKPVIWVSDIHSQVGKLKDLVKLYSPSDYTYVFNGDINDPNLSNVEDNFSLESSFILTYELVRTIVDVHGGHLLHSNHQKNLINLFKNKRRVLNYGLSYTAAELVWWGLDIKVETELQENKQICHYSEAKSNYLLDMMLWLEQRPTQLQINFGFEVYRCAHAYPDNHNIFQPFPKKEELYIYGVNNKKDNTRLHWWLHREVLDEKIKYLVGHYHEIFKGKNSIVFDPNCGHDNGSLGYIRFENKEISYGQIN